MVQFIDLDDSIRRLRIVRSRRERQKTHSESPAPSHRASRRFRLLQSRDVYGHVRIDAAAIVAAGFLLVCCVVVVAGGGTSS